MSDRDVVDNERDELQPVEDQVEGDLAGNEEIAQPPLPSQPFDLRNAILEELHTYFHRVRGIRQDHDDRPWPEKKIGIVSPEERDYYIEVHGFDPVKDRNFIEGREEDGFWYEIFFPLVNDPHLHRAGIEIGARVTVGKDIKAQNRIVFKSGARESSVSCIHTAVCTLDLGDAFRKFTEEDDEEIVEWARTTENREIKLPPEEHFASLKSYVAGIADLGISNMIQASYQSEGFNPETLPFGFNRFMQRQVFHALREIAPSATENLIREFLVDLVESVPEAWFLQRLELLNDMYDFHEVVFTHPDTFMIITEYLSVKKLQKSAAYYDQTHPDILEYLAQDEDEDILIAVAGNKNLSPHACKILLAHPNDEILEKIRARLARNPNIPIEIVQDFLGLVQNLSIRKSLAKNPTCPGHLLKILLNDPDFAVKGWARANPSATISLLREAQPAFEGRPDQVVNFNGPMITRWEAYALMKLEHLSGLELLPVIEIDAEHRGFVAHAGHISGLNLRGIDNSSLTPILSRLRWLNHLVLESTQEEYLISFATSREWLKELQEKGTRIELVEGQAPITSLREEMLRELRRLQQIMRGQ